MSWKIGLFIVSFLAAQGFTLTSNWKFRRAVIAANERLPSGEKISLYWYTLRYHSTRDKLQRYEECVALLKQSDILAGIGFVLLAFLVFPIAVSFLFAE